jgi:hypothetical protein
MDLGLILALVSSAGGYLKSSKDAINVSKSVAEVVSSKVNEVYEDDICEASEKLSEAKDAYEKLSHEEQIKIHSELDKNSEYVNALIGSKSAQSKVELYSKQLKEFKPSSTNVAVGTGDSAVSVQLNDESKKLEIQTNLATAKSEKASFDEICNKIKREITTQVRSGRTEEFEEAKKSYDICLKKYNSVETNKNNYLERLRGDETYMDKIRRESAAKYMSKNQIILYSSLESALPAYVLYKIWKEAFYRLNLLKEI